MGQHLSLWGLCPRCRRRIRLTRHNVLRSHTTTGRAAHPPCPGAHQPPLFTLALHPVAIR